MSEERARVKGILSANAHPIPDELLDRLFEYQRALLGWNEKVNLTSRRDAGEFFPRHIIGSISFLFTHSIAPGSTVLDAGTGGGLPGIPLAILYPDIQVTMVDSIQKKIKAVADIIEQLGLKNAYAVCSRVEDLKSGKQFVGKFDYVFARAVARAREVVNWCAPLVRRGDAMKAWGTGANLPERSLIPQGTLILMKGGNLDEEIAELRSAGVRNIRIFDLPVKGLEEMLHEKKMIVVGPL